jgi:hypothetical protein
MMLDLIHMSLSMLIRGFKHCAGLAILVTVPVKPSFRDSQCAAETTLHTFGQLKKEASMQGA